MLDQYGWILEGRLWGEGLHERHTRAKPRQAAAQRRSMQGKCAMAFGWHGTQQCCPYVLVKANDVWLCQLRGA